jgi:ABC-2 type transport system ATP-binding protein
MTGLVTCDERSFYWRLTGRQNLEFFGTLYGLDPAVRRRRIGELLDTLGLTAAADRRYQGYSSGMKQKLAIARGLLGQPCLLIYDEPTRSLDPLSAQQIRQWIDRERSRVPWQTHVIATNQLSEAEQLCGRVLIINRGRLIAQGSVAELRERWHAQDHERHRVTYRGAPLGDRLAVAPAQGLIAVDLESAVDGEVTVLLTTARASRGLNVGLEAILRSGGTVVRCQTEQASLDEIFCELVAATDSPGAVPAAATGGV